MRKYIYSILTVAMSLFTFSSCSYDDGVERGGDKDMKITLYEYSVSAPLSVDNDLHLRVCGNNLVQEVYYKVFSETDYSQLSESAIVDKTKSEGTKAELAEDPQNGGYVADFVVKDMVNACRIAIVGVNGNNYSFASTEFFGLQYEDICKGKYKFASFYEKSIGGVAPAEVVLQKCTNKEGLYRFKDLYGTGCSLKFYLTGETAKDKDGNVYKEIYSPSNDTPYSYDSYGQVFTRDYYTLNGSNIGAFYDDNYVELCMNYYVSAGSLGSAWEDFIPAE